MLDVVVIGAGPAGATIARLLARAGRDVLLVDKAKFPRYKTCGSCINSIAVGALEKFGLLDLLDKHGAVPYSELAVFENGIEVRTALPTGYALSRYKLDVALIDAAIESGVKFLPRTTARVKEATGDFRGVSLQNASGLDEIQVKLVVAADGLSGMSLNDLPEFATTIAKHSKFGAGVVLPYSEPFYEKGRIYMACSDHGYVGLVRIEENKLDVAAALKPDFSKRFGSPALACAEILESAGLLIPEGFLSQHWSGTGALTRNRAKIADERLFVVGDACGYTEPFTGEGMAWAFQAAGDLLPLANAAVEKWSPEFAEAWQKRHSESIGKKQSVSTFVASCLANGRWRRFCLTALSVLPSIARPVVNAVAGSNKQASLLSRSANVVEN